MSYVAILIGVGLLSAIAIAAVEVARRATVKCRVCGNRDLEETATGYRCKICGEPQ